MEETSNKQILTDKAMKSGFGRVFHTNEPATDGKI